jgi:hypothetical protein
VRYLAEDRRIQQYHADNNKYTDNSPGRLNSLLMFFIEKHILSSIAAYEKFSTKKRMEKHSTIKTRFDSFEHFNIIFRLERSGLLEQNAGNGQKQENN